MDEIKKISGIEFNDVNSKHQFERKFLAKDYHITLILYLIKNIEGVYFKGGTALNKIFLNHARLSEDIDFTLTRNVKLVKKEMEEIIRNSNLFGKITEDKNLDEFLTDKKSTAFRL